MTCTPSDTNGPAWAPGINSCLPWPEWLTDQRKLCDATTLVADTLACGGNESHLAPQTRARRITADHVARVTREWSRYAGEPPALDPAASAGVKAGTVGAKGIPMRRQAQPAIKVPADVVVALNEEMTKLGSHFYFRANERGTLTYFCRYAGSTGGHSVTRRWPSACRGSMPELAWYVQKGPP